MEDILAHCVNKNCLHNKKRSVSIKKYYQLLDCIVENISSTKKMYAPHILPESYTVETCSTALCIEKLAVSIYGIVFHTLRINSNDKNKIK